ncbi:MAG: DNA cytosine methyltransferase [Oscillospiraceae bacterium]|jgi:DNA (cytosine-5)-methyltransferase 1|nr:DNA cytosine methyltransferase [Oscillospiraceae bacterium]
MRKFIDLFCGIGGFRVALENRGLECVFSSDIDIFAQEAYKLNFGEKPSGNIIEIPSNKIPRHDILCAGFPCQPFSISGNRKGSSDPRSRLFYEVQRIAKYHKPYILLLENVKNILTIENGKFVQMMGESLDKIGYNFYTHVLNASHFGIPQSRERAYFVAFRKDIKKEEKSFFNYCSPKENRKQIFLKDILENEVDEKFIVKRKDVKITKEECDLSCQLKPVKVGTINKGGQGERIYSPKGHAITQSSYGGGVGAKTGLYRTSQGIRRLTINECKKVMGFPARHKVGPGLRGYQQLGNAVVPAMIGYIYDNVKRFYEKRK